MKIMFVFALLLAAGQAGADQQQVLIDIQHDSRRQVTCWITPQGGISCLPDSLLQVPTSTSTDESAAARASLANSGGETGRLPATPLPQEERFQL